MLTRKNPAQRQSHAVGRSLASIESGRQVRLERIDAGCNMQGRLLALGLTKGAKINIIANEGTGPLLIGFRESRITIGRGMAEKILVA
ncbi:MAG: ferrous iron transport protein A [Deltaproteobacteria bacterium]|nr:ferrous iron transport protein A [Deltaproteobacteria bacterium]